MGWKVVPNNILLGGTWYVMSTYGTESTTQPLINLNDWHHWNQAWVTANGSGEVLLKCLLSSASTNSDWSVSAAGGVNINVDGATLAVKYKASDSGSTNNYGTATAFASGGFDVGCGHPNFMFTGTEVQAQGWYFYFSALGAGTVLKIGNLVGGYALDLGYPERPEQISFAPTVGPLQTVTGNYIMPRVQDPQIVKNVTFADPTYTTKNAVWAKAAQSAGGPTYTTVARSWMYGKRRAHAAAAGVFSGLSTAGGSIPILYNEGTTEDTGATAGRPSYYGTWSINIRRNMYRTISHVDCQIVDQLPTGSEFQPTSN